MSNLRDLQRAIGGQLKAPAAAVGNPATQRLGSVAIDSREVQPGDVFWAVPGKHCDGEEFVDEAFARGAAGAVVAGEVPAPGDRWLIRVEDSLAALRQWAGWKRRHFDGSVIAVTGSIGKTTTRQMIHTVLKGRLRGAAAPRNLNNDLELPLSMLHIEPEHEYAVLELGAGEADEMAHMVELCRPTIGVITHAADAAPATPGSRHKMALAHAELLSGLPLDGYAVLGEDPWLRRAASRSKAPITWVGRSVSCDLAAADVHWTQGRLGFRVADCQFSVPVWGRHHLTSALIAVAVGRLLGFDLEETARALKHFDSVPMPCEVSEIRGATIIHDGHNVSSPAMRAALELLRDFDAAGRRIVLVGDMTDVGDGAAILHRQLGNQVVTLCGADLLIACGEHAGDVVAAARAAGMPQRHAIACRTPEESLPYLGQIILPGDVVLVKGSRVLGMQRVVDALKQYPQRRTA
jgi:UDP-N-acetylmuramoyl-tripeptide--D-alanyl-D-alanine ligase